MHLYSPTITRNRSERSFFRFNFTFYGTLSEDFFSVPIRVLKDDVMRHGKCCYIDKKLSEVVEKCSTYSLPARRRQFAPIFLTSFYFTFSRHLPLSHLKIYFYTLANSIDVENIPFSALCLNNNDWNVFFSSSSTFSSLRRVAVAKAFFFPASPSNLKSSPGDNGKGLVGKMYISANEWMNEWEIGINSEVEDANEN